MAWLAAIYERRPVRVALALAALALLLLFLARDRARRLIGDMERIQISARVDAMRAAGQSERCPRPPLRVPVAADGSRFLLGIANATSPERACLKSVGKVRDELQPPCNKGPCPSVPLASIAARPELVEGCASLFAAFDQAARASEACSPLRTPVWDWRTDDPMVATLYVAPAVRLQIAPLVARGELSAAAREVTNAMRFADDLGRNTNLVGLMLSNALVHALAGTLDEVLVDARLTADQATAIARDLDVLLASQPTLGGVVREEALAMITIPSAFITDDAEQDRALLVLATDRWLATFDRACSNTTLRECIERLEAPGIHVPDDDDYRRVMASSLDDDVVREMLVAAIAETTRSFMPDYARALASREVTYVGLRLQAELRTMPADACRDPAQQRARLQPLLRNDITVGADGAVLPPAWQQTKLARPRPPYRLRCI